GRPAGVLAAALVAVVPASQDILGWYGLANLVALVLLALLFCFLARFVALCFDRTVDSDSDSGVDPRLDGRAMVGMAVTLLGLVAAHRLSGAIGVGVTGLVVL